MSSFRHICAALAVFAIPCAATAAPEYRASMEAYYNDAITAWASDPVLIDAVRTRNLETAGYDQAMIDALDAAWTAEIGTGNTPTITPILENPVSDFLRGIVDASGGRISEIFLMDAVGLNVATVSVTSDMWQGDEAKFSETFGLGADALHFSDIELDESTGRYQAQISFTVTDPATGQPIGAMTVGVDADSLL